MTKIALLVAALGCVTMIASALLDQRRKVPTWVRVALTLSGVAMLAWVLATFYLLGTSEAIQDGDRSAIIHLKTAVGGFSAGMFVTLLMSGFLVGRTKAADAAVSSTN